MTSKTNLLDKSFEIEGYWWLPENPNQKIAGIVKFNTTNINLELLGTLTDFTTFQKRWDYEIILGVSTKGEEITLHKCNANNYSMNIPGISTSRYSALHMFVGIHFMSSDQIEFKTLNVRYSELDEWLGFSGFNTNVDRLMSDKVLEVTYTPPKEIKFQINDDLSAVIGFSFSTNFTIIGKKTHSITQDAEFIIESKSKLSLTESLTIIHDIQNFFTLATLTHVHTLRIEATSEKNKKIEEQKETYPKIGIYKTTREPIIIEKYQDSIHMLFRYYDIRDNVSVFFQKWFENKKILQPIYNLYFELIYNRHLATDTRFLLITQAVESYHRRISDETELDKASHEKRLSEIINSVPQIYKKWLEQKLRYSNELVLRKRIELLLKLFPFVLDKKSLSEGEFITFVTETRNYLTHYDKTREKPLDYTKIFYVSGRLEVLVESVLLKELGFTLEKIENLILKSKENKGLQYEENTA